MSSRDVKDIEQLPYDMHSLEALGTYLFFGEVDTASAYGACDFILKSNLLRKTLDPLTMFINTVGGECQEGFAVIDMMQSSRIPIATVGTGTIMSMGVLLISAGTSGYRTLTRNSEVMAHQFAGYFSGKQHELVATQESFKQLEDRFIRHFLHHSSMNEKQIRDVLFSPSDRYLTTAECKKYGLVDRVVDYIDQVPPRLKPVEKVTPIKAVAKKTRTRS